MTKRKIPYDKILFRIVTIAAGSAAITVSFVLEIRSLLVLALPVVIAATVSLFRIYGDIMKRINFIFNAVQNDDYAFRFADNPNVTDHALINYSLNRIKEVLDNAKLQIREKEKYFELITECADIGIITVMRNGGKISLLGISNLPVPMDMNKIICKGLTMQGIYGRKMDNWHQMSYMVQGGLDLTPVITHRFHYTQFEEGFAAMNSGKSGKVILDWSK